MNHRCLISILLAQFFSVCLAAGQNARADYFETLRVVKDVPYTPSSKDAHGRKIEFNDAGFPIAKVTPLSVIQDGVFERARVTLDDSSDYYLKPFNKAMHRNGICFSGRWIIDRPSKFTGLFRQGTIAPIIARGSVSLSTVEYNGHSKRSFGLVGKVFPMVGRRNLGPSANFFTVNHLNGTLSPGFFSDEFTNQPAFSFQELALSPNRVVETILLKALTAAAPEKAAAAGIRELTQLSSSGVQNPRDVRTPMWIKLKLSPNQKPLQARDDFRQELDLSNPHVKAAYPGGIQIDVSVADYGIDSNLPIRPERRQMGLQQRLIQWQKIGRIQLTESMSSYGCDFHLHFQHPDFKGPLPPKPK